MAVTRLKRKGRRNKQTATVRRNTIKQLTSKPVIKNVDIDEVKATFAEEPKKATKAKAKKEEAPKAEAKKEAAPKAEKAEAKTEETPKAEAKKPAKKAAPKKKAEKKEEAAEEK